MLGRGPLAFAPLAALDPVPPPTAPVHGTLGVTLGALSGTLSGTVTIQGTAAGTLFPLVLVGTGTVANRASSGALSATLGALTLAGTGHVTQGLRTGTLAVTLGPLVLRGAGRAGIPVTAWPHEWCPAPGASRTSMLAVDTIQFGDGYSHRITRGLKPVRPAMNYQFPFVGMARLNDMNAFLKANGARGFQFQSPDSAAQVFVTADAWSASITDKNLATDIVGTLQATFVERFNPQPLNVP